MRTGDPPPASRTPPRRGTEEGNPPLTPPRRGTELRAWTVKLAVPSLEGKGRGGLLRRMDSGMIERG